MEDGRRWRIVWCLLVVLCGEGQGGIFNWVGKKNSLPRTSAGDYDLGNEGYFVQNLRPRFESKRIGNYSLAELADQTSTGGDSEGPNYGIYNEGRNFDVTKLLDAVQRQRLMESRNNKQRYEGNPRPAEENTQKYATRNRGSLNLKSSQQSNQIPKKDKNPNIPHVASQSENNGKPQIADNPNFPAPRYRNYPQVNHMSLDNDASNGWPSTTTSPPDNEKKQNNEQYDRIIKPPNPAQMQQARIEKLPKTNENESSKSFFKGSNYEEREMSPKEPHDSTTECLKKQTTCIPYPIDLSFREHNRNSVQLADKYSKIKKPYNAPEGYRAQKKAKVRVLGQEERARERKIPRKEWSEDDRDEYIRNPNIFQQHELQPVFPRGYFHRNSEQNLGVQYGNREEPKNYEQERKFQSAFPNSDSSSNYFEYYDASVPKKFFRNYGDGIYP